MIASLFIDVISIRRNRLIGELAQQFYNGYFINRYGNPEVTWEVAKKANYGQLGLLIHHDTLIILLKIGANIHAAAIYPRYGLTTSISIIEKKSSGFDISLDYNQSFNNAGTYH